MLDVLGDGYIAQHVQNCILQELRERAYKGYVTDALWALCGIESNPRWTDIDTGWAIPEKEEDAAEIMSRLKAKINGKEGAYDADEASGEAGA